MIKKIITILILLVSCQFFLVAQEENENLVTFTEKDGIPSNTVSSILQDHLGYIWIATDNGLLKYDGYTFHRVELTKTGESSTYHPLTSYLFEDSELNLWIGVMGGVVKYNRTEETFHFYDLDSVYSLSQALLAISVIEEDTNGTIWLGVVDYFGSTVEDGLAYIKKGVNDIKIFSSEHNSFDIKRIYDIEIDDKNNLWISGSMGLSKLNLETMSLEEIVFENSPIKSFDSAILIDDKGRLWGGKWNSGFGSYEPSTGKVKEYSFSSTNSNSLSSNNVRSIIQDKDGTLWLGTDNGINHFNSETEKFNRYFYHQGLDINYKDIGIIRSILMDKSGSLWLGS